MQWLSATIQRDGQCILKDIDINLDGKSEGFGKNKWIYNTESNILKILWSDIIKDIYSHIDGIHIMALGDVSGTNKIIEYIKTLGWTFLKKV